jgi:CRISPR-associated endonuclease Csn1
MQLWFGLFSADRWLSMNDTERRRIVRKWIKEQSPAKLLRIAEEIWGLSHSEAEKLVGTEPEDGYAALSHVAISKLLPAMENEGLTYAEAVAKVYGNFFSGGEPQQKLSPVESSPIGRIPNPVVMRALTELRKVVNAVVREYKRPHQIRIELARSLKSTAEQRQIAFNGNKSRRRERGTAREIIEKDVGRKATNDAIEKLLLYWECEENCGGECVYCGERFLTSKGAYGELFSAESGIEVEHVLPKRCQDDSYSNKVLAHRKCNVEKGDRAPFQAFGSDSRWADMLDRVERLANKARLDRFRIETEDELQDFTNRHLSDTRYVSKLAVQYVEQLYGGRDAAVPWHDSNRRCVYVSTGALTARLRRGWGLESILREPAAAGNSQGGKGRTDHRHHAIDAIVLALTSERLVQQAATESANHGRSNGHLLPRFFSPPWPARGDIEDRIKKFTADIKQAVDSIVVSHRASRRLNGPLHKATYFSPKRNELGYTTVRVPVSELTEKDIGAEDDSAKPGSIADPTIRKALQRHLVALGGETKKLKTELPYLETRTSRVPIRYVRIRVPGKKMIPVRTGLVAAQENHHVVIFETHDPKKGSVWYSPTPVSLKEAMDRKVARRKNASIEVIMMTDGGNVPVFYLMKGDMVEMLDAPSGTKRAKGMNGRRDLYVLDSLSEGDYSFSRHNKSLSAAKAKGTTLAQLEARGDRIRIRSIDELRLRGCRKVEIDPLGHTSYLSLPVDPARGIVES